MRPLAVAGDEPGVRRRVVVVQQLEEEAEAAALARDRLAEQALAAVVVDRAVLAVRADEERHASGPSLACRRRVRNSRRPCVRLVTQAGCARAAPSAPPPDGPPTRRGTAPRRARRTAGAGGGDRLAVDVVLDVAGGEHARDVRLGRLALRDEIAGLVVVELVDEQLRGRVVADRDEEPVGRVARIVSPSRRCAAARR